MEKQKENRSKIVLYHGASYVAALILMSFGITMMVKSGGGTSGGTSMAYILGERLPVFTFGVWSYLVQGCALVLMVAIIRRMETKFLLAFVTSVIYGYSLDLFEYLFLWFTPQNIGMQLLCYVAAVSCLSFGVAFFMQSNMPLMVFELFVREVGDHFHMTIGRMKTIFDIILLGLAMGLSFLCFGQWMGVGIGLGTIGLSLVTGIYVQWAQQILLRYFDFQPAFRTWRENFER